MPDTILCSECKEPKNAGTLTTINVPRLRLVCIPCYIAIRGTALVAEGKTEDEAIPIIYDELYPSPERMQQALSEVFANIRKPSGGA